MDKNNKKPDWLRVRPFTGEGYRRISGLLSKHKLNTVCQSANCPNRGECFNLGTATFLIMGPNCTRNCRFCNINSAKPLPLDPGEPSRLAEVAAELQLKHVVVTSVTRDDLPDGGAKHFADTVYEIRRQLPGATIELLTPDFRGNKKAADIVIESKPDVFNHNVETIPALYKSVRPGADYNRSLELLRYVSEKSTIITKSGIMVGLGETADEIHKLFVDLVDNNVSILTIGQYLSPSSKHIPVVHYLSPDEFDDLRRDALETGLKEVLSSPLVRSSYHADESCKSQLKRSQDQ